MSCPKHSGEIVIPAGNIGWVEGDPRAGINACDLTEVCKPDMPGPWSVYARYASPTVAELTDSANDVRPPCFLELRWEYDSAAPTIIRAPIPAVGLCLSAPCPPSVRVGRYIATSSIISVRAQCAPGRPTSAWVGSSPSVEGTQAIPEFATRVHASAASAAIITWKDINGADLYSAGVDDVAVVDPRARYYELDAASGSLAFEVVH